MYNNSYYNFGLSKSRLAPITNRCTTTPVIDYDCYACESFVNPGYTKLTIDGCGANYWWLYQTNSLTHTWSTGTGTQIGSRNQTTFDITGRTYLMLLIECSKNNNSGYSVCTYTLS